MTFALRGQQKLKGSFNLFTRAPVCGSTGQAHIQCFPGPILFPEAYTSILYIYILYIYIYIYYTHTRGWGPFGSWKIYGFHIFQTIDTSMYGQSLPQSNCVNAVHCHKHCRNHCPNHCHFTRSSAGFTIAVDDDDVDTGSR
jgi:hypothetical protein